MNSAPTTKTSQAVHDTTSEEIIVESVTKSVMRVP